MVSDNFSWFTFLIHLICSDCYLFTHLLFNLYYLVTNQYNDKLCEQFSFNFDLLFFYVFCFEYYHYLCNFENIQLLFLCFFNNIIILFNARNVSILHFQYKFIHINYYNVLFKKSIFLTILDFLLFRFKLLYLFYFYIVFTII